MRLSEQLELLKAETGRLSNAVNGLTERFSQRLTALENALRAQLGEPDPDIQGHLDALRAEISRIEQLGLETSNQSSQVGNVPDPATVAPEDELTVQERLEQRDEAAAEAEKVSEAATALEQSDVKTESDFDATAFDSETGSTSEGFNSSR